MNAELISYFTAEKHGAVILFCMGTIGMVSSYLLWRSKSAFIAMAWPLLILGACEITIGGVVAWRTPAQVQQIQTQIVIDKRAAVSDELARMERVNDNFVIVKIVEILLIGMGQEGFQNLMHSIIPNVRAFAPVSGLFVMAFGGFLLYAFWGNEE